MQPVSKISTSEGLSAEGSPRSQPRRLSASKALSSPNKSIRSVQYEHRRLAASHGLEWHALRK